MGACGSLFLPPLSFFNQHPCDQMWVYNNVAAVNKIPNMVFAFAEDGVSNNPTSFMPVAIAI